MNTINGITTEKHGDAWLAYLAWDRTVHEIGRSEAEAIGKLWISASDQIITKAVKGALEF